MREVFETTAEWLRHDVRCALGTLVETYDSAPAPIGTTIAVDESGRIAGNVGAGCHEPEIVEACLETIRDGHTRSVPIDLSNTDEVTGTAGCGGSLYVAVWRPAKAFCEVAEAIALGVEDVTIELPIGFGFTIPARRRLILIGATALAQQIARMARPLDFFVTVVDPRAAFATAARIPDADELVLEWPDDYLPRVLGDNTALAAVSHDPKFDIPALCCALRSEAPYIGLLGSRRSQTARRETLRDMGFTEAELSRIHGPAGLDLGGHTDAETALSILAHIVASAHDRTGTPLDETSGAIHGRPALSY